VSDAVELALPGRAAPPMTNGEVVFEAPWQGRVFGMAHNLANAGIISWDTFREHLIERIGVWEAQHPSGEHYPYFDCFLEALEQVLVTAQLVDGQGLRERIAQYETREHGHDHTHD